MKSKVKNTFDHPFKWSIYTGSVCGFFFLHSNLFPICRESGSQLDVLVHKLTK